MKKFIEQLLLRLGYKLIKTDKNPNPDFEPAFNNIYDQSKQYTMTSAERMYALHLACKYVSQNKIVGDIVECGVWKGGSSMMAALSLLQLNDTSRKIYLYDTYEGMSQPNEKDISFRDEKMINRWEQVAKNEKVYAYSPLEEVQRNLFMTGYPKENLVFIKGKVEATIPGQIPNKIALLRLDTDWYESTYHELKHLFPLLVPGGILILDDYGHWKGAREATDQYFAETGRKPLLNRIDYTGRMMIKTE